MNHHPRGTSLVVHHGPPALAALIITELFLKLGSFTLELVGFVALWALFGWVRELLLKFVRPSSDQAT